MMCCTSSPTNRDSQNWVSEFGIKLIGHFRTDLLISTLLF